MNNNNLYIKVVLTIIAATLLFDLFLSIETNGNLEALPQRHVSLDETNYIQTTNQDKPLNVRIVGYSINNYDGTTRPLPVYCANCKSY